MSRNLDNLRDITTFLMLHGTSPTKGYTAAEISEAVPTLKERSVYRILQSNPQFVQTTNSIHPKRYYFDPLKVALPTKANSLTIRPEYRAEHGTPVKFIEGLVRNLKGEDSPIYKEVKNIGFAANNAIMFSKNMEALQPGKWEAAKYSIDNLEQFAAILYQRCYELKNDPRYNSPEWWSIFTEGL